MAERQGMEDELLPAPSLGGLKLRDADSNFYRTCCSQHLAEEIETDSRHRFHPCRVAPST